MTVDIWLAFQSCADVSLTFGLFMSVCNIAFICAGYVEKGRNLGQTRKRCARLAVLAKHRIFLSNSNL